jgi:hypothetical protein
MSNKKQNNYNEELDFDVLELPESLVENLVCKQLLNPLYIENSLFVQEHFKSQWFKNESLVTLFSFLRNYWKKYEAAPTKEMVYRILENDKFKDKKDKLINAVNSLYTIDETQYDNKFLQDTLIEFTKRTSYVLCNFR